MEPYVCKVCGEEPCQCEIDDMDLDYASDEDMDAWLGDANNSD